MRLVSIYFLLVSASALAQAEIHRCPQPDGTVAFQETPCPAPAPEVIDEAETNVGEEATPGDGFFDFVNPYDEPAAPADPEVAPDLPESISRDRELCEKTTRDAIDAIDLEMRQTSYTKEEGEAYLARLLELTEQLRACKQL